MGVFWLVVKLFGSLPAPVISGAFLDLACLIWQEVCDSTGFCWLYNDDTMFLGILAFRTLNYIVKIESTNLYTDPRTS